MKKTLSHAVGVMAVAFACYSCLNDNHQQAENKPFAENLIEEDVIKKGEHLVAIMSCNDCHSPKKMGAMGPEIIPELMLSGYPSDRLIVKSDSKLTEEGFALFYPDLTASSGPWGMSFAGNLTPDETGIGNWTEEQFKKAITQGKYKGLDGGRSLLPPMPWMNFKNLTNDEIHSIFTYLKSIKPVKNIVPNPLPPEEM